MSSVGGPEVGKRRRCSKGVGRQECVGNEAGFIYWTTVDPCETRPDPNTETDPWRGTELTEMVVYGSIRPHGKKDGPRANPSTTVPATDGTERGPDAQGSYPTPRPHFPSTD